MGGEVQWRTTWRTYWVVHRHSRVPEFEVGSNVEARNVNAEPRQFALVLQHVKMSGSVGAQTQ